MRCNRPARLPALFPVAAMLVLGGCGLTADEGPTADYRRAESAKSLEVPPDLTAPDTRGGLSVDSGGGVSGDSADGSASRSTSSGVLPEFDNVRFVRAGGSAWLEVENTAPDAVWPRIERFVRDQGFTVRRQEPALGVLETGWAERFDGPDSGGLTGFFNNILGGDGSDNLRDRYTIRLERMDAGGTRIFVAHHMAQEINTQAGSGQSADYQWIRRQADPSMEAEMARRLLVHLGVSMDRSKAIVTDARGTIGGAVRYTQRNGVARVMVDDPELRRVFVRVGDALTQIGAEVRSTQRDRGVYALEWRPPKGAVDDGGLFGLFGSDEPRSRRLELQLSRESGAIEIRAADEGGTPRSGDVHRALLREVAIAMGADEEAVRAASESPDEGDDPGDGDFRGSERPQSW